MMSGNILYTSLSSYLVDNATDIYFSNHFSKDSQEIDFLSFHEFIDSIEIPSTKEITFREFDTWFSRYKRNMAIKESYKIYEEFKGVLTGGVIDKNYLLREDYLNLGIKQSIFTSMQREEIYDLFERYLEFLKENGYHDINILSHEYLKKTNKQYDFIFIDEVQDLTNIQLFLILSTLKKSLQFVLSGDSNQIVHPNFFSWSHLKTMLFKTNKKQLNILKVLQTNYRNSPKITELSNNLLKIKNLRFGSIDKESTYLINSISKNEGSVNFYKDSDKLKKELNKKIQKSTKFAILVMDNNQKSEIKKYFKTPLVFSIQEAKGLEYDNIILVNFISTNHKEFRTISEGVESKDLKNDLEFSRVKDKSNKELEVYKFYINSLYVAFTRAIENLYIIESHKKHKILELLGLVEQQQNVTIDVKQSTEEEWKKEAQKLKKQGKLEQSEAIEQELNKGKAKIILSEEALNLLKKEAFDTEHFNKKSKDTLFTYAKQEIDRDLLQKLGEFKYKNADKFLAELKRDFKLFHSACQQGKLNEILRYTKKYNSISYANEENLNGLMIGAMSGNISTIEYFLNEGIDKNLKNHKGLSAFELSMLHYTDKLDTWYTKYSKYNQFETLTMGAEKKKKKLVEEMNIFEVTLSKSYEKLHYPYIKYKIEQKMIKIYPHTMEYFLMSYFIALKEKINKGVVQEYQDMYMEINGSVDDCLNMDDFMQYISYFPSSILPDYRKKRQYVNSILAKNELNSKNYYSKKLFIRRVRGCYDLNPQLKLL
ncbi:ATP-dependent DNA helicase UvrD/PcrA/Rep, epsilon proteobacterial type 2 [hydrothermal vent metagenome]|uniref:ATP-dependent DNA helicase UvrD/PcrA/Rep, epsilon proteobacterial type 2 n=1 Tax=hydrothermal vent metagenome TaxID=652676 RepID=A0A1W1BMA6_9ZZZZ